MIAPLPTHPLAHPKVRNGFRARGVPHAVNYVVHGSVSCHVFEQKCDCIVVITLRPYSAVRDATVHSAAMLVAIVLDLEQTNAVASTCVA